MYEVVLTATGDRAEAANLSCALFAARTLATDSTRDASAARRVQRTAIVTRDGQYDGLATALAKEAR